MSIALKIVSRDNLPMHLASLPRPLIFTNGVFDILHPGHVRYLEDARALGVSLLVALNDDVSARLLGKGDDRPVNTEADRAIMIAALASVSLVTTFGERTPVALLHKVRPDLYVKGGDYDIESLEETRIVRGYGGDAKAIAFHPGYSTTSFLRRIRAAHP